jgi:pimeloyl-ACP methyl ester carboxylesterase
MWLAEQLGTDGAWSPVTLVEVGTNSPFSSAAAYRAVQSRDDVPTHLLELLRATQADSRTALDAIELWSGLAEEQAREFDWTGAPRYRRAEEAIACDDPSPGASLAWHDRTGIVLVLDGSAREVRLSYEPSRDDERRAQRIVKRHATPQHTQETWLDWRGFVGERTGIVDGWSRLDRRGTGFVARLRSGAKLLIATVLRRASVLEWSVPTTDRRQPTRLKEMEDRFPYVADACVDLARLAGKPALRHERALVFVHGTMSCGIVGLKDLFSLAVEGFDPPGPVFRFEHDTFDSVFDNAKTLSRLIRDHLQVGHLMLAAHSRGGLVAVHAARRLRALHWPGRVTVCTFGAPFLGTPLVALGQRGLNLLVKLGEEIASAVPVPVLSALAKAHGYLVEAPKLPAGIAAMDERAEGLDYIRESAAEIELEAWGSDYDIRSAGLGYGIDIDDILYNLFGNRRNDLVVTLESARACGAAAPPVQACSHVHYFRQQGVRDRVDAFLRGPRIDAPGVPSVPAPEGAATPTSDVPRGKPFRFKLKKSPEPPASANEDPEAPPTPG